LKNILGFLPYFVVIRKRQTYSFLLAFSILLLFLASAFFSCSPHRQNLRPPPEPKSPDQIISEMKRQLNLSNEQEVSIRPIIENQVKKRDELIRKYQALDRQSVASLRDELKDLRIVTERQLQYFLTSEQMIDYGYMQQEEDQRISSARRQEDRLQMPKGRERRPPVPPR
jgi:hypothetical protein